MKRVVFSMIRKGNDKTVDNSDISKTQRSSYDEATNQDNANHSLSYQRYCTFEFTPQGQSARLPMQSY
jgi:hypothetical protein